METWQEYSGVQINESKWGKGEIIQKMQGIEIMEDECGLRMERRKDGSKKSKQPCLTLCKNKRGKSGKWNMINMAR